jgi:predicted metal-dependent enzyme (double-stranded beta helix superfamily)
MRTPLCIYWERFIMFDKEGFIQDCVSAAAEGQGAIQELVARAVSQGSAIMGQLGEPQHAGINTLYRAKDLTIINFVWAPCMSLMPHNHRMFSVVGIYAGREDNVFWRRTGNSIEAVGAKSLGVGDVTALERDAIHSVLNPIGKMTCAIHVYGGDFFAPPEPRSLWEHETLVERPWDVETVKALFADAEARFKAWQA